MSKASLRAPASPGTKGCDSTFAKAAAAAFEQRLDQTEAQNAADRYRSAACDTSAPKEDRAGWFIQAARTHHFLAVTHWSALLHSENDQGAAQQARIEHAKEGAQGAWSAMGLLNPTVTAQIEESGQIKENAAPLSPQMNEAIYWYAVNLGVWAAEQGVFSIKAHQLEVQTLLEFLEQRAPYLAWSGSSRWLGIYHTLAPLERPVALSGKAAFQDSLKRSPNYFLTRVFYAQHYAILRQDRELYIRELRLVLATPKGIDATIEPENTMAQKMASVLLNRQDELVY